MAFNPAQRPGQSPSLGTKPPTMDSLVAAFTPEQKEFLLKNSGYKAPMNIMGPFNNRPTPVAQSAIEDKVAQARLDRIRQMLGTRTGDSEYIGQNLADISKSSNAKDRAYSALQQTSADRAGVNLSDFLNLKQQFYNLGLDKIQSKNSPGDKTAFGSPAFGRPDITSMYYGPADKGGWAGMELDELRNTPSKFAQAFLQSQQAAADKYGVPIEKWLDMKRQYARASVDQGKANLWNAEANAGNPKYNPHFDFQNISQQQAPQQQASQQQAPQQQASQQQPQSIDPQNLVRLLLYIGQINKKRMAQADGANQLVD